MSDDNSLARLLVGGKNILWRISISFALRLAKRNSLENNALPAKLFTKIGLSLLLGTGKKCFQLGSIKCIKLKHHLLLPILAFQVYNVLFFQCDSKA